MTRLTTATGPAALSDLMGRERAQITAEANDASAGDFYAVFKREELGRKHNEFSAVATMAREGRL
jgi:hypothetical protein